VHAIHRMFADRGVNEASLKLNVLNSADCDNAADAEGLQVARFGTGKLAVM